jgi:hypothetical protein
MCMDYELLLLLCCQCSLPVTVVGYGHTEERPAALGIGQTHNK